MDEREKKISIINKQIQLTEEKLRSCFGDQSALRDFPKKTAEDFASPKRNTNRLCCSAHDKKTTKKIEERERKKPIISNKPQPRVLKENPSKSKGKTKQRSCSKCNIQQQKTKKSKDTYEGQMKKMQLKKMRILDSLHQLEEKKSSLPFQNQNEKEKHLKYQISVLKAEIMNERENEKKISTCLEKFSKRSKHNNFYEVNSQNKREKSKF